MKPSPFILIYTGPTGVGKTSLVDAVCQKIPSEIINIDMAQMYEPFSIGTAKPALQLIEGQLCNVEGVVHHLFNVVDQPEYFTVARYREMVIDTINTVWDKKKIPILVGGSGFYVKSLFYPAYAYPGLQARQASVGKPPKEYAHIPKDLLWGHLNEIDPVRASSVEPADYYRIERALDIWYGTGIKPSEFKPVFDPPCSFFLTCITRDRAELYERINKRVYEMIEQGWIDEVQNLLGTEWESFLLQKKLIGYDAIIDFLQSNETDKQQLITLIQQKTRNYAKRQFTFWRSLKKQVDEALSEKQPQGLVLSKTDEVSLGSKSVDEYIKALLIELQPVLKYINE